MGKDTLTLAMSGVFALIMHTRMSTQDVNCGGGGGTVFASWSNCQDCCSGEYTLLEIMGCQVLGDVWA